MSKQLRQKITDELDKIFKEMDQYEMPLSGIDIHCSEVILSLEFISRFPGERAITAKINIKK